MLYSFQTSLPRLPVPAVKDTVTRVRGIRFIIFGNIESMLRCLCIYIRVFLFCFCCVLKSLCGGINIFLYIKTECVETKG